MYIANINNKKHGNQHKKSWLSPLPKARYSLHQTSNFSKFQLQTTPMLVVFKAFQKFSKLGACQISGGRVFQRAGATTEKAHYFNLARRQHLRKGTWSTSTLLDLV